MGNCSAFNSKMSTTNIELFGGEGELDLIDMAALVLFPVMAGMIYGIFSFTIDLWDFSFTDVAFTLGGFELTWAFVVSMAAFLWVVVTNQLNQADYEDWEYGVIAFAFLAIPAYLYVEQFAVFVDGNPWVGFGLWILVSVSAVWVSYTA